MNDCLHDKLLKNIINKAWRLDEYLYIVENLKRTNVALDEEYQKRYNSFYRVRRNADWRNIYFNYLEKNKYRKDLSFEEAIKYIYAKTGSIEASFVSKLVATINPNMPIWDKNVLNYFGVHKQKGKNMIDQSIQIYNNLYHEYEKLLMNQQVIEEIYYLRNIINCNQLSDIKLLDFIVWTLGENDKDSINYFYGGDMF